MCESVVIGIIIFLLIFINRYRQRCAQGCLKNLDKEELKDLFQELGLFDQTVRSRYSEQSIWPGPGFWGGMGCCWTRRGTREEPPGRT